MEPSTDAMWDSGGSNVNFNPMSQAGLRTRWYALSFHIEDSGLTYCAVSLQCLELETGTGEMGLRGLRGVWGASKGARR